MALAYTPDQGVIDGLLGILGFSSSCGGAVCVCVCGGKTEQRPLVNKLNKIALTHISGTGGREWELPIGCSLRGSIDEGQPSGQLGH